MAGTSATAVVKITADTSGLQAATARASQSLDNVGGRGAAMAGAVSNALGRMSSMVGGEVGTILNEVSMGLSNISETAHGAAVKLQAAGAAGIAAGSGLMMIGAKDKQAQDQLAQAIQNTGADIVDYQDKIDATIKTQEGFGHAATDTQYALQKMTQATGSTQKALNSMQLVANLAAAKHISLADAATMVDRIMSGKGGRTLAEFGITMGKGKDKTVEAQKALDELAKKLSGQASAAADNFNGKLRAVQATVTDNVAAFGEKFGPAITASGAALGIAGTVMDLYKARQVASIALTEAQTAATAEATVAQEGLDTAMVANPIGLIILAVVAFVAALVLAYNKIGWFHDFVDAAFHGIATVVGAVVGWIKDHWQLLLVILMGPIGLAIIWITQHWDLVRQAFAVVWQWIASKWPTVYAIFIQPIATAIGWITSNWGRITAMFRVGVAAWGSLFAGVYHSIVDPISAAISAIRNLWNSTIGGKGIHLPAIPGTAFNGADFTIPKLAQGGIITRPTLALVGEAGPEAVVPLSRGGGLGGTTHVTVLIDGREVGAVIRPSLTTEINRYKARNGFSGVA